MIGTHEDAAEVLASHIEARTDYLMSDEGSTRLIYILGDVVYKIARCGYEWENRTEFENYADFVKRFSDVPDVEIAKSTLYTIDGVDIIAMEYVEGTQMFECYCCTDGCECEDAGYDTLPANLLKVFRRKNFIDCGAGNVIRTDDDQYVIIDYAY